MRKVFSSWIEKTCESDPRKVFLTGDLGYNAFESLSECIGPRFVNVGVCEQNMDLIA